MGCSNSKEKETKPQTGKTAATTDTKPANPPAETKATTPAKSPSDGGASPQIIGSGRIDDAYEIGDEIGRGAFSVVKKGKNKKSGKEVAIKFIEKKFVDKQDLVLLGREIDIMKQLDHPNVLKLFEVFETDEIIALIMELVNGGELFYKIVEKGNYSEKDAASIVTQMIRGVEYLHGRGIAHRDLKPENLLCSIDDNKDYQPFRVVIADFGLSKAFGEGGEALETSCGTPDYVAPEVITADGTYDNSVDMWSCGVITYVLLCGFSPFLSSNQTGLFEKIMKAEYDFPDPEWTHISEQAKDFIRKLLVKEPEKRFTAAQCNQHPWLNGQNGQANLAEGKISNNMSQYNAARKATKKTL